MTMMIDDTDDGILRSVAKQPGPSVEPALLTQNFHLSKLLKLRL